MNTTGYTNSWVNQFLFKEDLQNLWNQKMSQGKGKQFQEKKPVKKFTLDLNAALVSDRLKKVDKNSNSCNIREGSSHRQVKKTQRATDRK